MFNNSEWSISKTFSFLLATKTGTCYIINIKDNRPQSGLPREFRKILPCTCQSTKAGFLFASVVPIYIGQQCNQERTTEEQ